MERVGELEIHLCASGSGTRELQDASARSNPRGEAATDLAVRPQPEEHEREILGEGENAHQGLVKSSRPNGPAEQILRLVERTHIGDDKSAKYSQSAGHSAKIPVSKC